MAEDRFEMQKCLVFSVISLLLVLFLVSGEARAERIVLEEGISEAAGRLEVPSHTVVNGDVSLNLGEIIIDGIVNGSVRNNLGQVIIRGDVTGDVNVDMGQVLIEGNAGENVRVRMGEINVVGTVDGNLRLDQGAARLSGALGGDLIFGNGDVFIGGITGGDIEGRTGRVIVEGRVEGDVDLERGVVELAPGAVVAGTITVSDGRVEMAETASAGRVAVRDSAAGDDPAPYHFEGLERGIFDNFAAEMEERVERVLHESMPRAVPERVTRRVLFPAFLYTFPGSLARSLLNMILLFALAALLYTIFPKAVNRVKAALVHRPGPVIGWGLLAVFLAFPLMLILLLTIIGIPLIFVEVVFIAAAASLGYAGLVFMVGERVVARATSRDLSDFVSIAAGVGIIGLAAMLPLVGALLSFAVFTLALGAALVTRLGTHDPEPAAVAAGAVSTAITAAGEPGTGEVDPAPGERAEAEVDTEGAGAREEKTPPASNENPDPAGPDAGEEEGPEKPSM